MRAEGRQRPGRGRTADSAARKNAVLRAHPGARAFWSSSRRHQAGRPGPPVTPGCGGCLMATRSPVLIPAKERGKASAGGRQGGRFGSPQTLPSVRPRESSDLWRLRQRSGPAGPRRVQQLRSLAPPLNHLQSGPAPPPHRYSAPSSEWQPPASRKKEKGSLPKSTLLMGGKARLSRPGATPAPAHQRLERVRERLPLTHHCVAPGHNAVDVAVRVDAVREPGCHALAHQPPERCTCPEKQRPLREWMRWGKSIACRLQGGKWDPPTN